MKNNRRCDIRKALLLIESETRRKAAATTEIATAVVYGAVALEVQRKRLDHECSCARCLRLEVA